MHGQIKLFMNPVTHHSLYGIGKSSRIPHQAKPSRETIIPHQAQPIFNQYSTSIPPMKNNAQRKDISILTVTVNQNRERELLRLPVSATKIWTFLSDRKTSFYNNLYTGWVSAVSWILFQNLVRFPSGTKVQNKFGSKLQLSCQCLLVTPNIQLFCVIWTPASYQDFRNVWDIYVDLRPKSTASLKTF